MTASRSVAALVTLVATTSTMGAELNSERRYAASINQTTWSVEQDDGACHLLHPVPRFGLAVFSRNADGEQALRIYTHRPPRNTRTVELWSEPTEWRGGAPERVGFTRAIEDPRTFLLSHPMANRVLQELERGKRPVMTFEDWHSPGEQVALAISNAGFRPAYERYLGCAGDLRASPDGDTEPDLLPDPLDGDPGTGGVDEPVTGTVAAAAQGGRPTPPASGILARHGQTPREDPDAAEQTATADDNGNDAPAVDRPVHFVFDDTGLTRTEKDHLNDFLEDLDDDHGTITITGHTDNTGDADYNRRLGEARAEAVRDYLVEEGVDDDRIAIATAGEDSPTADNDSAYGQAANRRASLQVDGP